MSNNISRILISTFGIAIAVTIIAFLSHNLFTSELWQLTSLFITSTIIVFAVMFFSRSTLPKELDEEIKEESDNSQLASIIITQASELAINSAEVSFFLQELSKAIETSSEDVDRLATAASQLSSNSKQINDNAALASEQSNQAMSASSTNAKQLGENIAIVNQLNEAVNSASTKIQSLETKAAEIQSITDVIDGISAQTNLLALNAAIEAARAGEQGRGFAVVADEVRALAAKTADATAKIGEMLQQIGDETRDTTTVMSAIVEQTDCVVTTMTDLSDGFEEINQLMSDSSNASKQISHALAEQDTAAEEISSSVVNLHDFLIDKSEQTAKISTQAASLSHNTEAIFLQLSDHDEGSLISTMCQQAQQAANNVSALFEEKIISNQISTDALFDFNYKPLGSSVPAKYTTRFDKFTDQYLPTIQEPLLIEFKEMIYAGAVDINGYFPTHNQCFSKPLTGDPAIDVVNNRTKRLFDDPTGIRCAKNKDKFLLQTYKRDTGEIMHDVSAPIFVNGKHWGGFRIGFRAK
ncbi:methyl-accepting chemotaxis protein [Litorilituus lipolyticus]|uniref:Methyl-accepting chemotaxis protein n=1 Tax=Litorilituus lipolyticus TaxID=2491017 RepID=A0A502KYN1_9GAMM|nr:methyl-accepting chemotaxis protein [Litorilituus lipolyticus]TPH13327.1 methyl-accepting chemotaxis protein [Litorilituus lipolyticus]